VIKGIGHKKVEITNEEYLYYLELVKRYSNETHSGEDYFVDLFQTDKSNNISVITPTNNVPWVILFFVQNLMINQRLRINDSKIDELERKIDGRK